MSDRAFVAARSPNNPVLTHLASICIDGPAARDVAPREEAGDVPVRVGQIRGVPEGGNRRLYHERHQGHVPRNEQAELDFATAGNMIGVLGPSHPVLEEAFRAPGEGPVGFVVRAPQVEALAVDPPL